MEPIDFIIDWVDNNDSDWIVEKNKWAVREMLDNNIVDDANSECRYRSDEAMLRYWFRSVEKFAPWVNKIFFVTCGQKPSWLNESHPKLYFVNHGDYIPYEYLPTFNAATIEMNYHRIKDLSEHFVLFNDDTFLLQHVDPQNFFINGEPVLDSNLRYWNVEYSSWSRMIFNAYCIINKSFDISKCIWNNRRKWFSLSALGYKRARRNLVCFLANRALPVGTYGHIALPHLKSTLEEVWEKYYDIMDQMCKHKFRRDDQMNQWLLCAWNQAKGNFYPAHVRNQGVNARLSPDTVGWVCEIIRNQSAPQICVNDSSFNTDPIRCGIEVNKSFDSILLERSAFEKD